MMKEEQMKLEGVNVAKEDRERVSSLCCNESGHGVVEILETRIDDRSLFIAHSYDSSLYGVCYNSQPLKGADACAGAVSQLLA